MEKTKSFDDDMSFIKAQFENIPELTLPDSLTAARLWARVDAGELTDAGEQDMEEAPHEQSKVIELMHRYRPILSYAAVFVAMVLVYYGAGLDSSPVVQPDMSAAAAVPEAAMPRMVMSSGAPAANENAAAPAATPMPEAAQQAPMMAESPPRAYNGIPEAYSGEPVDFTSFADNLRLIKLEEGESLSFSISQGDNMLFINISTAGEERLRGEIDALMEECAIPGQCVSVSAVAP